VTSRRTSRHAHARDVKAQVNGRLTVPPVGKIDEAHGYKNLRTPSNIRRRDRRVDARLGPGHEDQLPGQTKRQAGRHLRHRHPIANSITEAYVMQHYLRPDLLESAGITDFDTWAATFGETIDQIEMAPEGGNSFRQKTRFARSPTSRKCSAAGTSPPTSKPPTTSSCPSRPGPRPADGQRAPETVISQPATASST